MKNVFLSICVIAAFCSAPGALANNVCQKIISAAVETHKSKVKGMTKEEVMRPLPSRKQAQNNGMFNSLYQIIDEVYDYPTLDKLVYATYRSELCYRAFRGQAVNIEEYSKTHKRLKSCGLKESNAEKTECGKKVASLVLPEKTNTGAN